MSYGQSDQKMMAQAEHHRGFVSTDMTGVKETEVAGFRLHMGCWWLLPSAHKLRSLAVDGPIYS